jgi:hypothetical protein
MEPTDATIIGVYFLNYTKSISICFGHYYAHHQETRKRDFNNAATHNIYNNTIQAFSPYVTGSFT